MFATRVPGLMGKRILIFTLCFLQYVFVHSCRSTWSYVSGKMTSPDDEYFSKKFLGYINFSFLFFYGGAISILGQFGDRMSLKVFVLTGTFTTSIIFTFIGVLINCQVQKDYLYLIFQIVNGISQSTAWPGLLAILNNWFLTDKKVILLGYFAACPNVGNIVGDFYSGQLIGKDDLPLYTPIYLAGLSLLIISIINIQFLENAPDPDIKDQMIEEYEENKKQVTMPQQLQISMIEKKYQDDLIQYLENSQQNSGQVYVSLQSKVEVHAQLTYFNAWFVPHVATYAFAFGCVKAVYYILGFWLPTYLNSNNVPDVAWITAMTDVGSIPGGIVICLIGYYFDKRAIIIVPSLWIGTLMMISINFTSSMKHEVAGYMCLIFFTGLFIGGCYNNISSAITVELSNQPELKHNKQATSTVVSVIVGYAAIFSAINQLIVPYVDGHLFLYCGALAIIAGAFLIPLMIGEIKRLRK